MGWWKKRRQRQEQLKWWHAHDLAREKEEARKREERLIRALESLAYRPRDEIIVSFDEQTEKAIKRFVSTAIDMQGMIELVARWMVYNLPPEVIEEMEPPPDWTKKSSAEGTVK